MCLQSQPSRCLFYNTDGSVQMHSWDEQLDIPVKDSSLWDDLIDDSACVCCSDGHCP